ncbi:hypothetical protein LX16_2905 [Stackebrandtia albiflava]|uniref:Uncharacterized protein n=1 Tax=Stackebrandtia albiflava TaxID=406432 RepID=A0A562V2V8_9ACTN|nr:hypothetical protein [Stackebrandtia albiflava]TWJ12152.1 hypothetical protein LX16_2905 [Stackebrandtia albiflava]
MDTLFGDRRGFSAEIGEGDQLRRVDLWAAGIRLTCDDNTVYVPQFRRSVADTADRLRSGSGLPRPFPGQDPAGNHRRLVRMAAHDDGSALYQRFATMHWGPTTDNVTALLFRDGDHVTLTFGFWRAHHLRAHPEHDGAVFVVEIAAAALIGVLDGLTAALESGRPE